MNTNSLANSTSDNKPFSIFEHISKLTPAKEKDKYYCPVCQGHNLSIEPKDGAYKCWNDQSEEHKREGNEIIGKGNVVWLPYRIQEVEQYGKGKWLLVVEGERCAIVCLSISPRPAGLVLCCARLSGSLWTSSGVLVAWMSAIA